VNKPDRPDPAVESREWIKLNQLIDLDRYPLHRPTSTEFRELVTRCQRQLATEAIASLPGFIRPSAIDTLASEASDLVQLGHRFDQPRVTNFDDPEYDGSDHERLRFDHLRTRAHENRYCQVLNHHIPNHSDIRSIYRWPQLTEFVRQVLKQTTLFPSLCPHLALSMKVAFDGDQDGWHYDPNDGVITLMLQSSAEGGEFEYAPYIRAENHQNYPAVEAVFQQPDLHARKVRIEAGTFTLFNGRRSMHRVRKIQSAVVPRIVAIFCYDRRPDQVFSQHYIDLVRSFPQGPPTSV